MKDRLLGDTIRAARMEKGYTQEKLANIEGGRRNPSVPLLFQMMALLDFSVDALVFPDRAENRVLHTNGLTEQQIEALSRLIDTMKTKPAV